MSGLAEIQEAIIGLPEAERLALAAWLDSQNPPIFAAADETILLKSLDAAIKDLDSGKGTSIGAARNELKSAVLPKPQVAT